MSFADKRCWKSSNVLPTSMSAASGLIIRTGVVKTYSLGFSTTHTQIFIYIYLRMRTYYQTTTDLHLYLFLGLFLTFMHSEFKVCLCELKLVLRVLVLPFIKWKVGMNIDFIGIHASSHTWIKLSFFHFTIRNSRFILILFSLFVLAQLKLLFTNLSNRLWSFKFLHL